ncbi:hypothetical protein BSKO_00833 [Bryopsis sp. KO-2023]|nr:hypothetical protein BSKO_00833 [Bryopsis sp. KO-2023]
MEGWDATSQEDARASSDGAPVIDNGTQKPARTRSNALDVTALSPRRAKRIVANREAAHRSRMRKLKHMSEMEASVSRIERDNEELQRKIGMLQQQYIGLQREQKSLFMHAEYLRQEEHRLQRLNGRLIEELNRALGQG